MALGDIAVNMLFGGTGSRIGSAMVPLDRALLSSNRLSIVSTPLSVMVWSQFAMKILTAKWHLIPSYGCNRVHECDRLTHRPRYGNICYNRQNH